MGRTPKAWYRANRDAWVVELGGKQVRLARGKASKREAEIELRRLLVERDRGRPLPRRGASITVGELMTAYLADIRRRVEEEGLSSYRAGDIARRLKGLDAEMGDLAAVELRPSDVMAWVSRKKEWGATSRADAIAEVRALFRWAIRDRRIEVNPIEGIRAPQRAERRAAVIDPDEVLDVVEHIASKPFRDLYLFIALTGCRPKEARTLEARHVDWRRAMVVRTDHKSYARTRKARVIPLPWHAYFLAWVASQQHPNGPIFRNARGGAWTKDAINCQICRIRKRSGRGAELVAYALRHGFATRLLESTGDIALGAAVLGHSSTAMLSRVYGHLEGRHEHVRAAVDAISRVSHAGEPTHTRGPDPLARKDSQGTDAVDRPPQLGSTSGRRGRRPGRS